MKPNNGVCVIYVGSGISAHALIDLFNSVSNEAHWGKIEMRKTEDYESKVERPEAERAESVIPQKDAHNG